MHRSDPIYASYRLIPNDVSQKLGGTCIVVRHRDQLFLVTARHCIDRKYRDPRVNSTLPSKVRVHGFIRAGHVGYNASNDMIFELGNWTFGKSDNDIAVAVIEGFTQQPVFVWHNELFEPNRDQPINVGTEIVFSGYPDGVVADDPSLPSIVLRRGILASHLSVNISVPGALGRDYSLIDAFSQNGFSGSPVFALVYTNVDLHQTLADFSETLSDRRMRFFGSDRIFLQSAPVFKFLGINCGHFKTHSDLSSGVHAGLSYFARSSIVVEALTRCANVSHLDPFVTVGTANTPIRNRLDTP